jgi:hypothetical protein
MFALGLWLMLVDVDEDMFRTLRQLQTSIVGGNSPNPSYSSLSQHGQMRAQDSQLESDFSSFLGTLTPENVFTVVVDVNPHVCLSPARPCHTECEFSARRWPHGASKNRSRSSTSSPSSRAPHRTTTNLSTKSPYPSVCCHLGPGIPFFSPTKHTKRTYTALQFQHY